LNYEFEEDMLNFSDRAKHNIGGNRMRRKCGQKVREDLLWQNALSMSDLRILNRISGSLNRKLLGNFHVE